MESHQLMSKPEVLEKFHDSIRLANRDDRNRSCSSVKAALGSGKESLYKWSRSHDQDGGHGYK